METEEIRRALAVDAARLTTISFASKAHWKYPPGYFDIWRQELTISPTYIENPKHDVFVFERSGVIQAYYCLVELDEQVRIDDIVLTAGAWLEHMFVDPEFMGIGVGTRLFHHLVGRLEVSEHRQIKILADPNARPFYQKMGCTYRGEYPSCIAGRTTPYLVYELH